MKCARQGCENEVQKKSRGPQPRFCSGRCRQADLRRRRRTQAPEEWSSAIDGAGGGAELVAPAADPDVQVVAAVHETIMLRNTSARLGQDARPELAVRCESMAKAIGDGLLRNFRGAVDDE
jgi:hypothetical protein